MIKLSLCITRRYMWEWRYNSTHSLPRSHIEVRSQLYAAVSLPQENSPRYLLNGMLGSFQIRSWCLGEEHGLLSFPGNLILRLCLLERSNVGYCEQCPVLLSKVLYAVIQPEANNLSPLTAGSQFSVLNVSVFIPFNYQILTNRLFNLTS